MLLETEWGGNRDVHWSTLALTRFSAFPTHHPPTLQLLSFFEPQAQAPKDSMRANPNRFVNIFEKDLYNPMKIYAQARSLTMWL